MVTELINTNWLRATEKLGSLLDRPVKNQFWMVNRHFVHELSEPPSKPLEEVLLYVLLSWQVTKSSDQTHTHLNLWALWVHPAGRKRAVSAVWCLDGQGGGWMWGVGDPVHVWAQEGRLDVVGRKQGDCHMKAEEWRLEKGWLAWCWSAHWVKKSLQVWEFLVEISVGTAPWFSFVQLDCSRPLTSAELWLRVRVCDRACCVLRILEVLAAQKHEGS